MRLAILGLVFSAANCCAEDFYFAQDSRGTGTGANASEANQVAFLSNSHYWNSPDKVPGKIGPGDTIHLLGTITSPIIVRKSGTRSAPITIFFESGAKMTAPVWPETGAISLPHQGEDGLSDIIIDGGVDGVIENTDNGSELGHQDKSSGIWITDASRIRIKNLRIANLYVHPRPSTDPHSYGSCVLAVGHDPTITSSEISVTNCEFHDARMGFGIEYGTGWSNFEFSNCLVYNCNWGGIAGDAYKFASLNGLRIHHNRVRDWSNWDDTGKVNRNHHNAFFGWAASGGTLRNVSVYANAVGPHYGTHATSGFYFSGDIDGVIIYNNLFLEEGTNDHPMDGLIFIYPNLGAGNSTTRIYNNTFIGSGSGTALDFGAGQGRESTRYEIRNNLAVNVSTFVAHYANSRSNLDSNNNLFFIAEKGNPHNYTMAFSSSPNGSAHFLTLDSWRQLGHDDKSVQIDPSLSSDFHPKAGSLAESAGINLSNFFANDKDGHPRPTNGPWEIGAFQR